MVSFSYALRPMHRQNACLQLYTYTQTDEIMLFFCIRLAYNLCMRVIIVMQFITFVSIFIPYRFLQCGLPPLTRSISLVIRSHILIHCSGNRPENFKQYSRVSILPGLPTTVLKVFLNIYFICIEFSKIVLNVLRILNIENTFGKVTS